MTVGELLEALERGERDRKPVEAEGLRFTHLDRVLWPGEGYTKGDLVRYYVRVAEAMVRYVEDRALMLKRYPRGVEGKGIVQQRARWPAPDGVRTARLRMAGGERVRRYVGGRATLLFAAQLSAVEIHTWHSRVSAPSRPDWIVLDLDPSPGVGFGKVVRVARALRARLQEVGLDALVKTSGSRGLHLYVPTGGQANYRMAATLARLLAERVAEAEPGLATVERTVSMRGARVYIDHLQNARGKVAVAPYSVRARPGASVSAPVAWEEVVEGLEPQQFRLQDVPARLEQVGDLWAGVFRPAGDLAGAIEALRG
jgi:bifunctional non-homologous end joining protein LigD